MAAEVLDGDGVEEGVAAQRRERTQQCRLERRLQREADDRQARKHAHEDSREDAQD